MSNKEYKANLKKKHKERQFIKKLSDGKDPHRAITEIFDIGSRMDNPTPQRVKRSATVKLSQFIKDFSEENRAALVELGPAAVNKLAGLMDAKKPVYHFGAKVDEHDDNSVQLAAAKTILEMGTGKPTEKKEVEIKHDLMSAVCTIRDMDGNVIEGSIVGDE